MGIFFHELQHDNKKENATWKEWNQSQTNELYMIVSILNWKAIVKRIKENTMAYYA